MQPVHVAYLKGGFKNITLYNIIHSHTDQNVDDFFFFNFLSKIVIFVIHSTKVTKIISVETFRHGQDNALSQCPLQYL